MSYEYIKPDELLSTYHDASKAMKPLFEPFDEYERISRNKPHPGIDRSLPKVTDGTLAALIQEKPKSVIQQIPTGKLKTNDDWLNIVGEYIYTHEILANANYPVDLIQKCWVALSKALTYGSQPAFVQFMNYGEYFGTDFSLPYIRDVFLEPGKLSDKDSNVIFLRTWWSKSQVNALIHKENKLERSATDRGDSYQEGWNRKLLQDLLDTGGKQKDATSMTPSERGKLTNSGFYEIDHAFQRGNGANFYSFSPLLAEGTVLRTKANPDPRGVMPIHYLYASVDMSNPLGRGAVELSGGMQNLLDSEVQSYQYMRALLMNPPLKVKGNVATSTIKYAPAALWKITDPTGDIEPANLSTTSLEGFSNNYGLMKSQILNLNSGGQDNAISSQAGDPQSSKTQAGVQQNAARLGISDNYLRKSFEGWFEQVSETMVNIYFAERSGTQELTLDKESADKLREVNPQAVNELDQVRVNYDDEATKMSFTIDPASSTADDDQNEVEGLQQLLQETTADPLISYRLQMGGYQLNIGEAYKQLFERYHIRDIDKIITPIAPEQAQQAQMPMVDKPQIKIQFSDLVALGIPEAVQGALQDGGINVPIESIQQALASGAQTAAQQQQLEAQKQATADQQAQLQAVDMAHKHAEMQHNQVMDTSAEALKLAQAHHSATQAEQSHALSVATAANQADQARQVQAMAEKQATKGVAAGGR